MAYIDQFFEVLVEAGASDLHLAEGQPPKIRAPRRHHAHPQRAAHPRGDGVHDERDLRAGALGALSTKRGDLDFAYEMDEHSRFRCNFLKQTHGYGCVFRLIPTKIMTLEQLGIPPVVKEFGQLRGGLVLVTGPTGSGKSTTLAALIDYINIELHPAHHHRRGADRIRAREQAARSSPSARCPSRRRSLRRRPESRAARGRRHRARRRNARPRNHLSSRSPPRRPACSSSARCTRTTRARPSTA